MFSMMILRTEFGQPRGRPCWEGLMPAEESSTLGLEAPACEGDAPPDIVVSKLPGCTPKISYIYIYVRVKWQVKITIAFFVHRPTWPCRKFCHVVSLFIKDTHVHVHCTCIAVHAQIHVHVYTRCIYMYMYIQMFV